MKDYQEPWKQIIADALNALIQKASAGSNPVTPDQVIAEIPPNPEMGDIGFPMFGFAKTLRKGPPQIAVMVCEQLAASKIADSSVPSVVIYSSFDEARYSQTIAAICGGPLRSSLAKPNMGKPMSPISGLGGISAIT